MYPRCALIGPNEDHGELPSESIGVSEAPRNDTVRSFAPGYLGASLQGNPRVGVRLVVL